MNLYQVIASVSGSCAQRWCAWRAPTEIFRKQWLRGSFSARAAIASVFLCSSTALASNERLKQAEHEFQLRSFDSSFDKFKEIQADPLAVPADLALARCRLGIIYSIRDDQKQARRHLELALASEALPVGVAPLCFYALVQIYVIDKSYAEARDLINKYPDPAFPAIYKARIHALGTEIGKQLKEVPFEINQLERLGRVMDLGGIDRVDLRILGDWFITRDDVRRRLGETLKTKPEPAPVVQVNAAAVQPSNQVVLPSGQGALPSTDAVLGEKPVKMNSAVAPEAASLPLSANRSDALALFKNFRAGQFQASIADMQDGSAPQLQRLNPEVPLELIRERAEQLLKDDPRQIRVGVILPLGSGVFMRLQLKALKGISAFLNSRATKDVDYRAFVRTVGNDAGAAEQAAHDLILKDKVHLIVGPFHGAQVIGSATVAAFYGVPLFTLGPVTGAQEYDPAFVLRMGTLATSQARAQAGYLKQNNRNVVAVMSPSDGYGVEMTRSFESVCKEAGIQLARVEFIDESTEVFQEPVRALLGPQEGKFRGPEYAKLVADARKKAAVEKRKFDPSQIKAPAFVPFSALYVPDSLDRVRLIANTFAFFEARSVRFLGDRTWQEAGGRTSIADQFLNRARVPVQRPGAFLNYLRRDLSAGESVLDIERQAFDSLLLTRTAQYKASGNNPAKLVGALRTADFSADAAGRYGAVDASGEPAVEFEMAQYYNGNVLSPNVSPESLSGDQVEGD